MERVPDELLHIILSPCLDVPDRLFVNDQLHPSPFAPKPSPSGNAEPCKSILLVCKRWLRVCTPLLYEVVIIRSSAQARALARSLQGDASLGKYIRKLRIEGAYGASMQKILTASPKLTDFFLTLEIWSNETITGD